MPERMNDLIKWLMESRYVTPQKFPAKYSPRKILEKLRIRKDPKKFNKS